MCQTPFEHRLNTGLETVIQTLQIKLRRYLNKHILKKPPDRNSEGKTESRQGIEGA